MSVKSRKASISYSNILRYKKILLLLPLVVLLSLPLVVRAYAADTAPLNNATSAGYSEKKRKSPSATGETGRRIEKFRAERRKKRSAYTSWKRGLPFWPRKAFIFLELGVVIALGVFIGQMLEVSGLFKTISILAWPLIRLGRLPRETGPAFLMAFQSGAVANSMLVSYRDDGELNNVQLYTSVLVVSCISLFAHLPTFIFPLGMAFGWQGAAALFGVKFVAIAAEIVVVLLVARFFFRDKLLHRGAKSSPDRQLAEKTKSGCFWSRVWKRSRKTITRLLIYLLPTFVVMSSLEYLEFFDWLAVKLPGLFQFSFLPAESVAVIPAQAVSLYNGAIVAANFIDSGNLTVKQAVVLILFGSLITAPIRTLKHALPTYLAVLGARPGFIMAFSAQLLRSIFLLGFTLLLIFGWN